MSLIFMTPLIGSTDRTGRYNLISQLAEGGMGTVYHAEDTRTKKTVAVKVIHPNLLNHDPSRARFRREQEILIALSHPFVVQGLDSITFIDEDTLIPALVMEYVEGEDLLDILRDQRTLPLDEVALITLQIALALGHVHSYGIVHRDLRDDNIKVQRWAIDSQSFLRAHLLDFSIAKVANTAELDEKQYLKNPALARVRNDLKAVTYQGSVVGSPEWMAPEQARGDTTIDGRADLYGLGINLYQMIAGRLPFSGYRSGERQISEPPPPFSASEWYKPSCLETVCLKLLEKDPDKRYQTGRELARAVLNALPDDKRADVMYQCTVGLLGFDWMRESRPAPAAPPPERRIVAPSEPASYARGCE